ncbi:MAG: hypothetical protein LBS45_09650 [Synergistaceae bacterium]|nr:hypothetical protein [Synergistaceae bacterium]
MARTKAQSTTAAASTGRVEILAPAFKTIQFLIEGNAPYVQLRFSQKQKNILHEKHASDSRDEGAKKKKRESKDFDALFEEAMYLSKDGKRGLNAMSFKRAMVSACRLTALPMKKAKLCFDIEFDGFDEFEDIPMVYFTKGEPQYAEHRCLNANQMPDLRVRAMWPAGWQVKLRVRYDSDALSSQSVANLLMRAGVQVGIGEGRPDTNRSDGSGMGWGTFQIIDVIEAEPDEQKN